jgi:hypothetical protein
MKQVLKSSRAIPLLALGAKVALNPGTLVLGQEDESGGSTLDTKATENGCPKAGARVASAPGCSAEPFQLPGPAIKQGAGNSAVVGTETLPLDYPGPSMLTCRSLSRPSRRS